LSLQIDDEKEARILLERVDGERVKNDPTLMMQVAWARQHLGLSHALALGFQARRVGFGQPDRDPQKREFLYPGVDEGEYEGRVFECAGNAFIA